MPAKLLLHENAPLGTLVHTNPASLMMDPQKLMGTWYVTQSTLKLWSSGGRRNPSITYELLPGGEDAWSDTVRYEQPAAFGKSYKHKSVKGVDRWIDANDKSFRWQGAGCLALVKCDCKVGAHPMRG